MKKQTIAGVVLVLGMLSVGALSASAAGSCCIDGKCSDQPTVQQFTRETASLTGALKAKDIKLRELAAYDTYDIRKQQGLEEEIKVLKEKINTVGEKFGIPACCRA